MSQDCCPVSFVAFPKGFANMFCINLVHEFIYNSGFLESIFFVWLSKLKDLIFFFLVWRSFIFSKLQHCGAALTRTFNKDRLKNTTELRIRTFNKQVVSFIGLIQAPYIQQEEFALFWLFVSVGVRIYSSLLCLTPITLIDDLPVKAIAKVFLCGMGVHM